MKRGTCKAKKVTPTRTEIQARPFKGETPEQFAARVAAAFERAQRSPEAR